MKGRNLSLDLFGEKLPMAVLPFSCDREEEAWNRKRLIRTLQEPSRVNLLSARGSALNDIISMAFLKKRLRGKWGSHRPRFRAI